MVDGEIGLAEAIDVVRGELRKAQDGGRSADVRFSVGSVEVELAIEVVKKAGGEASIKVLTCCRSEVGVRCPRAIRIA